MSATIRFCIAMALVASLGCTPDVGTVSGTVTWRDKPLPVGSITFFGKDNRVVFCPISEDGTYQIGKVPTGEVMITVETPKVKPQVPKPVDSRIPQGMTSPEELRPYVRIPEKYSNRQTSGLNFTVQPGEQTFDIRLEESSED